MLPKGRHILVSKICNLLQAMDLHNVEERMEFPCPSCNTVTDEFSSTQILFSVINEFLGQIKNMFVFLLHSWKLFGRSVGFFFF